MKRHTFAPTVIALVIILFIAKNGWAIYGYPPLHLSHDPKLQQGLEKVLDRLKLRNATAQKQLCIALVDITNLIHPKVASVNGDHMVYAASLVKIAILLAAFKKIEMGEMSWDEDTRMALTEMIRFSSNQRASEMLIRVRPEWLASTLQSPQYQLYSPQFNGGLWCGKEFGARKAWKRDPLHNLSHGATAMQTARFYYLMVTNRLVKPHLTALMMETMSKPSIHHKFVKGLENRPGTEIYRKSGTWKIWHSDSVLVEYAGHRYIAIALTENPAGGKWLERLIVPLHDLIVRP